MTKRKTLNLTRWPNVTREGKDGFEVTKVINSLNPTVGETLYEEEVSGFMAVGCWTVNIVPKK